MIDLSKQQNLAFEDVLEWFNEPNADPYYALAGYAGTGKTTMAYHLYQALSDLGKRVFFAAYTGKAAHVLQTKGCPATTIHYLIYQFAGEDANGDPMFIDNIDFDINSADLIIVDEYSMLNREIVNDLLKREIKVLFLGDTAQLPPIEGDCPIVHDFQLTEIHRQAWESPILRAATRVRNGERLKYGNYGDFIYRHRKSVKDIQDKMLRADQVICGYNKTRRMLNNGMRRKLGFNFELPMENDKMICLKNNREYGLYNGLMGRAASDARIQDAYFYKLNFENSETLSVWNGDLFDRQDGKERQDPDTQRFDFGYAITCHKAQGSEFDKLFVVNEPVGVDGPETWLYTAITRAKQKLLLVDF